MKNILKIDGKFKFFTCIINLLIPFVGFFIISILIKDNINIYKDLQKPSFFPPFWILLVMWGVIYLFAGIAVYRIRMIKKCDSRKNGSLFFYSLQLILNLLWPIIFFSLRLYGIAWIELVIIILLLIITIIKFFKIDKVSGILLVPYILWSGIFLYLNIVIWMLNEM
ncbi:tryptophan-rich sensory protein [Clostridium baratii]|uniref:TspO/MBR family protein n=1 Tax=Clostridium baratii TaxID=1561 RepID=UPI00242FB138|nr:TspO/MBR family protein [Clostridium baratii]MBS6042408.1 tryptophan-rich sensory protein [Clostridium baratii]